MAEESVSEVINLLVEGVTSATVRAEALSGIVTHLAERLDEMALLARAPTDGIYSMYTAGNVPAGSVPTGPKACYLRP